MNDPMPARTFWQWMLMYPTLLVALLGAFPTFRDIALAIYQDVSVSEVVDGRRQSLLWSNNIACLTQPIADHKTTPERFEIGAAVCPSGDVLVHIRSPEAKEFYRWIPFRPAAPNNWKMSALLIGEARAAEPPPLLLAQAGQVICQRKTGSGQIVRRIRTGAACVDELIDMTSGRLLRRVLARCEASC
jgi:hypothetical protein